MGGYTFDGSDKIYFCKESNIDDMIRLDQIAGFENEFMKYKIFFVFKLADGMKVFTSLN
jgi:hypothetical protein